MSEWGLLSLAVAVAAGISVLLRQVWLDKRHGQLRPCAYVRWIAGLAVGLAAAAALFLALER